MRQAGRYLPQYQEVREQVTSLTLCATADLATEVTLQPVARSSSSTRYRNVRPDRPASREASKSRPRRTAARPRGILRPIRSPANHSFARNARRRAQARSM
ncbi:MAG TPA: hypothetical protein DFS52_01450 [Myxococcales bacterium]|nr:hypothetical protein [Myxococcales bacterium]